MCVFVAQFVTLQLRRNTGASQQVAQSVKHLVVNFWGKFAFVCKKTKKKVEFQQLASRSGTETRAPFETLTLSLE